MVQVYDMNEKVKSRMRTPTGFRIVGEEAAYLAPGSGGPHMCMEIDDFTSLSTAKFNLAVYVRPCCAPLLPLLAPIGRTGRQLARRTCGLPKSLSDKPAGDKRAGVHVKGGGRMSGSTTGRRNYPALT